MLNIDLCENECVNTEGSYICQCYDGYQVDSNGHSCTGKYFVIIGLDAFGCVDLGNQFLTYNHVNYSNTNYVLISV